MTEAGAAIGSIEEPPTCTVELHWTYTPADYFERPVTEARQEYGLSIDDGKANIFIDGMLYDATPGMRAVLHQSLETRFLAVQSLAHCPSSFHSRPNSAAIQMDGWIGTSSLVPAICLSQCRCLQSTFGFRVQMARSFTTLRRIE